MYHRYFHMSETAFDALMFEWLLDILDWKDIGISNELVNNIIEPKWGLKLINWTDRAFQITHDKKYTLFAMSFPQ